MIQLESPSIQKYTSYISFIEEMKSLNETIWELNLPLASESPEIFVNRLIRSETKAELKMVCESTFWAVQDQQVVGRIALRHVLNDSLKEFGGHIGYEVRPSARKKGIATQMLKLVLETPKAKEIGRILLTCAPNNTASNKTIVANGGVLEKTVFVPKWNRDTNYYWITL